MGNKITPDRTELSTEKESNVTLSCSYSSAVSLQWYRQYPRSAPQFLLFIISPDKTEISAVEPRFSGRMNKERNQMFLDISSAKLSDSALYYCALRPTVKETGKLSYKNWHDVTWDDIHHTLLSFQKNLHRVVTTRIDSSNYIHTCTFIIKISIHYDSRNSLVRMNYFNPIVVK